MEFAILISLCYLQGMSPSQVLIETAMNAVWRAYDTLEVPEPQRSVQTQAIEAELFFEMCNHPEDDQNDQ